MTKIISITVKIAGLIITSPVTWNVAGVVFGDVQPASLRLIVQAAALIVVEGVFLASWLALDGDKAAPPEVKTRHALTALAMYGGLWVLALYHGEGLAGIVFRLALGLALLGSIYDSGVYSALRAQAATDRDIMRDGKVKRHARNLARQTAIAQLDANGAIELQRISLERQRGLTDAKAENRALIAQNASRLSYPIDAARAIRDDRRADKKRKALPRIRALVAGGTSITEAARAVGVSRQAASKWLQESGMADSGGNGHEGHVSLMQNG